MVEYLIKCLFEINCGDSMKERKKEKTRKNNCKFNLLRKFVHGNLVLLSFCKDTF